MISQADLEALWICLRGSEAPRWQMPAWHFPSGSVLNCLQWKVLKVDFEGVYVVMNSRFSKGLREPCFCMWCTNRSGIGLQAWFPIVISHLWSLNSMSVQPPPSVFLLRAFAATATTQAKRMNIIIAAFKVFVLKPLENSMQDWLK